MESENISEGDIVLCTVDKIVGTTVFVRIENDGEGTIIFSEVSPGRIRNIRNYVVPKKRIVCKVLRISGRNVELSLRRVTQQEKKDRLEEYNQEKKYRSMLKLILKEKAEKIIDKITQTESLYDFFENAKENPKRLEKLFGKEDGQKILEIIRREKKKRVLIKKKISLKTKKENGLEIIQKLLGNLKEINTKYLSGGKYSLEVESEDPKKTEKELKQILEDLEKNSKKEGVEFSLIEK